MKGFKKRVQQCLDEFNLLTENEKHVMVAYQKWNTKGKEVLRSTDFYRRDAVQVYGSFFILSEVTLTLAKADVFDGCRENI